MTSSSEAHLETSQTPRHWPAVSPTGWLRRRSEANRQFAVALSGGSTPRRLYELLSGPPYREAFPWARTHWFWGDERFVPHDSPESNYRMVREAMLARAPVPAGPISIRYRPRV